MLGAGTLAGRRAGPPPASSTLPFAGLLANGAAGSEYRERAEDALSTLRYLKNVLLIDQIISPECAWMPWVMCQILTMSAW